MFNKLLLLLIFFLPATALFSQKKVVPAKTAHPVHTVPRVKVVSASIISPERKLRLADWVAVQKSLVVLKNDAHLLPLGRLDTLKILIVSIGMGKNSPMPQLTGRYIKADYLTFPANARLESISLNLSKSKFYNLVVLAISEQNKETNAQLEQGTSVESSSAELGQRSLAEEEKLLTGCFAAGTKTIYMLFGGPLFLSHWTSSGAAKAYVVSDKVGYDSVDLSVQLIFGAINSVGKLPFDLNNYRKGDGISLPSIDRLSYVIPEELGMDSVKLSHQIDSLVGIGLKANAFPGCQLLMAKKGKVFYFKSYGFHRYDHREPVTNDDIYDLASVTKVLAPVPALMMLADQKKFLVTKKMSDYWPDWKGSNKAGILVSDLLSHQARLRPGVVLWPLTMDGHGHYLPEYFADRPTPGFDLRVSGNLYLKNSFQDTVYRVIRDSPLLKSKKYVYSDLGFVIMPKVIEKLTGEQYETFLHKNLYDRLGTSTLMYNPYLFEPMEKIVPTEDDRIFRHDLLQGFVHDETAALLGGVSGNAGLFGSAGDVAKVMQLYLQDGEYGNERYISAETLKNWTSSHFQKTNNRRGFGFDKPGIQVNRYTGKERYPSSAVSEQSYGHSGYTGTFVWADPVSSLLFVFLSNRVFPDRDNHKINKLKLRPLLLESFFKLAGETTAKH